MKDEYAIAFVLNQGEQHDRRMKRHVFPFHGMTDKVAFRGDAVKHHDSGDERHRQARCELHQGFPFKYLGRIRLTEDVHVWANEQFNRMKGGCI
jgi:hypothetical protein